MKITKKIVLLIGSIVLGFTLINCSEDSEDTSNEKEQEKKPITLVIPDKPEKEPQKGRTLNPDNKKPIIVEKDGEIRAEFEVGSIKSPWKFISIDEKKFEGSRGDGYITWTGAESFNKAGGGILEFIIRITTPGEYVYRHRVNITKLSTEKNPSTEHNDVWLSFPDADGFYARPGDNSITVYPRGGANTPANGPFPKGTSDKGYFKVFYNTLAWGWAGGTSDFQGFPVYIKFDKAGDYKMLISARSSYLGMDEFALSNKGVFNDGDTITKSEVLFEEDK